MKNKFVLSFSSAILLVSILGCSFYNPLESSTDAPANANRTAANQTADANLAEGKIGVPECDEILDFFAAQTGSPDEDFVTRAAREYALGKVREQFKQTLEEYKTDNAAMARECRQFKTQLDKYKAGEANRQSSR